MGSIVYRATKDQVVHDELQNVGAFASVLAHRSIGNRLWFLAQNRSGEQSGRIWIGLTLIDCRNGQASVKNMDESCGPYYFDCPLAFLDRADPPIGPHSGPWRDKVREFHANRAAKRAAIRAGLRVAYDGRIYELRSSLGRRGWEVLRDDGVLFRMKARQLQQATVLPPLAQDARAVA
jgi:hypothetical protein